MSLSLASSSATVAVDKATSDLLMSPDWSMNIDICDSLNSHHWQAKDVIKAVKKRLQHRNSKVQILALTLLETMVKNCGDYVHSHIAERNILGEMIKIVKKKADMHVRDKIMVLLDSWQEAFGGSGGKYPQYYWAYDEIRRSGVEFPKRLRDAVPIITPPLSGTILRHTHASYGMPSNSIRRLDETMATEIEGLSISSLDSMRDIAELLSDMLQATNPTDSAAVKDDVIMDLVNQSRANQKKLMQMLTTTGDEELLGRGLEVNDGLQNVLAKHDAMVSGSPLLKNTSNTRPECSKTSASNSKLIEIKDSIPRDSNAVPNTNSFSPPTSSIQPRPDDEEEEDEFAQLARRNCKMQLIPSQASSSGIPNNSSSMTPTTSPSSPCKALARSDPPTREKTSPEQNMIDLLSINLSTPSAAPPTAHFTAPYNNYIVPWAQPEPYLRPQTQPPPEVQQQNPARYSSPAYPPPPWAVPSVYSGNQGNNSGGNAVSTLLGNGAPSFASEPPGKQLYPYNSFSSKGGPRPIVLGNAVMNSGPRNPTVAMGQKPFVPSYRLFEDLNVFGNLDGRLKVSGGSTTSSSLAGATGPSMVSRRK